MTIRTKFDIGDEVKDKVSGFTGTVVAVAYYFTKCTHYALQPRSDGKNLGNWEWLDGTRLKLVKSQKINLLKEAKETSGDFQAPNPGYTPK